MGGKNSKLGGTTEERRANDRVEKAMKEAKEQARHQLKVLLLGTGDSGKSTILKQMRLIHRVPFTSREIESYRQLVFQNLVYGMKLLLDAMPDMDVRLPLELETKDNGKYLRMFDRLPDVRDGDPFPMAYLEVLKTLWTEESVQMVWLRGNEIALPENLAYFFPQLDRLFAPGYRPSVEDIVRTRARSIGISETVFRIKGYDLLMVDVGGQKSERRKWIHCFEDVTCVIFLVALNGYDQSLAEDRQSNQMQDAMTTWKTTANSRWFLKTSFVLFLNKEDLFNERIMQSNIRNVFPDYEGPEQDANAGREYFRKRFIRLFKQDEGKAVGTRQLYVHYTSAVDTEPLRIIMSAIEDILIQQHVGWLL